MGSDSHDQQAEPYVSIQKVAFQVLERRDIEKRYEYFVRDGAAHLVDTVPLMRLQSRDDRCCVLVSTNEEIKTSAIAFAHRIEEDLTACGVKSERLVLLLSCEPHHATSRAVLLFGGDSEDWWPAGEQIAPGRPPAEGWPTLSPEERGKRFRGTPVDFRARRQV